MLLALCLTTFAKIFEKQVPAYAADLMITRLLTTQSSLSDQQFDEQHTPSSLPAEPCLRDSEHDLEDLEDTLVRNQGLKDSDL